MAKLNYYKNDPKLKCEICSFSFSEIYGDHGLGFIEAHHKEPISRTTEEREVTPSDFAMLCANCHRMIHRQLPWLTVDELKDITLPQYGKP